jgi:hypothetical protein
VYRLGLRSRCAALRSTGCRTFALASATATEALAAAVRAAAASSLAAASCSVAPSRSARRQGAATDAQSQYHVSTM